MFLLMSQKSGLLNVEELRHLDLHGDHFWMNEYIFEYFQQLPKCCLNRWLHQKLAANEHCCEDQDVWLSTNWWHFYGIPKLQHLKIRFVRPLLYLLQLCRVSKNIYVQNLAGTLFSVTMLLRISVRPLATCNLEALRTRLKIFHELLMLKLFATCIAGGGDELHGPILKSSVACTCLLVSFTHFMWYHTLQTSHSIRWQEFVLLSSILHFGQGAWSFFSSMKVR